MTNLTVTDPGNCRRCGGSLPVPRHGRRFLCLTCGSYQKTGRGRFKFAIFEVDWNAGVSVREIAEKHDVTMATVYRAIRLAGVKRERSYTHAPEIASASAIRAKQMAQSYVAGLTLKKIGEIHGVTRERVRQILARQGITGSDGGKALVANRKRKAREIRIAADRDARCQSVYGCSFAVIQAICGDDVSLTKNKITRAFTRQKVNAVMRGIEFAMTFAEWWSVWQQSGHWHERGRGQGYVMARNGDSGPYAIGNVHICTQSQNSKESFIKTPAHVRAAKRAANPNAKSILGRGRGYTKLKRCVTRPYQVMCGSKRIGCFATEEEARAAYLAACEERRREAEAVLKRTI